MNTTKNRKKSVTAAFGAAAAAVAAPALLFLGAGTAHASDAENADLAVTWYPHAGSLGVSVHNKTGSSTWCTYTSRATLMPLIPAYINSFPLASYADSVWTIYSPPTGVMWDTTVSCTNGASLTHSGLW